MPEMQLVIDVLEEARAAIIDKRYGKGLSKEYMRAMVDRINAALEAARAQAAELDAKCG